MNVALGMWLWALLGWVGVELSDLSDPNHSVVL